MISNNDNISDSNIVNINTNKNRIILASDKKNNENQNKNEIKLIVDDDVKNEYSISNGPIERESVVNDFESIKYIIIILIL